MVNRRGQSPGKPETFDAHAEIGVKVPEMPMDGGAAFQALGKLFDHIGAHVGDFADAAAKREGGDAGTEAGRLAFEQSRPLALRHDGTIRGDATDHAAKSAYAWRWQAATHTDLGKAYDELKDDPAAFAKRLAEIRSTRLAEGNFGKDKQLEEAFAKSFQDIATPLERSVATRHQTRVDGERRAAADEALVAGADGIARSAYLAGADPASAAAVEADVGRHRARIDGAVAEGVIPPDEGRRRKTALVEGVVTARLRGVFDALPDAASKLAFVDGLEKRWAADDPALSGLNRAKVEGLMKGLRGQARSAATTDGLQAALDRRALEAGLDGDIASIRATGEPAPGAPGRDDAHVARVLGADAAAVWRERRASAETYWASAGDFPRLSGDAMAARLAEMAGSTDPATMAAHREASAAADRLLALRASDPARAVDEAVPGVRAARTALDPVKPETFERLAGQRLTAQAGLGIPEEARRPLTTDEARAIVAPIAASPPDKRGDALAAIVAEAGRRYGGQAQAVRRQLLEVAGAGPSTADVGAAFLDKVARGTAGRTDAHRVDVASELDRAAAALTLPAPVDMRRSVPASAVDLLRRDPSLAKAFDEKYGAGVSDLFLVRDPMTSGTTTMAPDGTEGWRP